MWELSVTAKTQWNSNMWIKEQWKSMNKLAICKDSAY